MPPKRPRDPNQLDAIMSRVTPAMAVGVSKKLLEVSDIVAMLEQWERTSSRNINS
jgi:hypothetical protein